MDSTTDGHLAVRGSTTDPHASYPTPAGSAPFTSLGDSESMRAARATQRGFDAITAPLVATMQQSERALGTGDDRPHAYTAHEQNVLAEHIERECAVLDEAETRAAGDLTSRPIEIFDPRATQGLLAEIDAALREDGCVTDIGVRRNARGYITGLVVYHHRRNSERGR